MKNYLTLIIVPFFLGGSDFQEDPALLKDKCFGGDAKACAGLEVQELQRCGTIPKDNVTEVSACRSMAQCWRNCRMSIEQAYNFRMRYGKDSQIYQDALMNKQRILGDSCKLTFFNGRTF